MHNLHPRVLPLRYAGGQRYEGERGNVSLADEEHGMPKGVLCGERQLLFQVNVLHSLKIS